MDGARMSFDLHEICMVGIDSVQGINDAIKPS